MIRFYARLRLQVLRNLLLRSGLPVPVVVAIALAGALTAVQFAGLLGTMVARAWEASPATFPFSLSALFLSFQLVLTFVVLGSVSLRLFDPRKSAEFDTYAALPLRRIDLFLIQVSDVALVPVAMVLTSIVPAMVVAGWQAGFGIAATVALASAAAFSALLPIPAVIALSAFALRAIPAWLFRRRALLFATLAAVLAPVVPLLTALVNAWREATPASTLLPATWAALGAGHAVDGRAGSAAPWLAACAAVLFVACVAAYLAYNRMLLERFDEVLAKLAVAPIPEDAAVASGRRRRAGWLARLASSPDPVHAALLRKETLGLSRDPALQFTFFALAASAATFALLAGRPLAGIAASGIAFLAVYMAASLGLASFSQEGRGLPVLAPLPLAVDDVLRAKLRVNTVLLGLAGAAGTSLVVLTTIPRLVPALVLGVLAAPLGAVAVAPLGAMVTAMGALFPRRLLRTGRREISIPAMSFFSALALLFYASVGGALAGAATLGPSFLWMPAVVLAAWVFVAAALVSEARKAVRRGRWDG